MRAVVHVAEGVLELNFMWLPTAIGMNSLLKKELEASLASKLQGLPLDEPTLDKAHELVVEFLVQKLPEVKGLARYLDGLKYLEPAK